MKAAFALCAVMFVVLVSNSEANPIEEIPQRSTFDEPIDHVFIAERADRHRRVTCDLISMNTPWGSLGHSACAAHCLVMGQGYRGGYCNGQGICVCRK